MTKATLTNASMNVDVGNGMYPVYTLNLEYKSTQPFHLENIPREINDHIDLREYSFEKYLTNQQENKIEIKNNEKKIVKINNAIQSLEL